MLNSKQIKIVQALSRYKFLSRSQMVRLGIEYYKSNFSKYCSPLVKADYIGQLDGKKYDLGIIYYLKRKGASYIENNDLKISPDINYVRNDPNNSTQFWQHRKYAIDCQIELNASSQELNIPVLFYERDIETVGSIKKDGQLIRKTRITFDNGRYIEPDANFKISTPNGDKLYCLELENRTYTKQSFEKMQRHISALNQKLLSKKYDHPKAYRILMVYTDISIMNAVMSEVKNNISDVRKWVLFKAYDQIQTPVTLEGQKYKINEARNFYSNWKTANGDTIGMV